MARRDAIRSANAVEAPTDLVAYRAREGVRGAMWGITADELIALKGAPAERTEDALLYQDEVDAVRVPTTYSFFQGHLAEVRSTWRAEDEPLARLESGLTRKHGDPSSRYDKAEATQAAIDDAQKWDIAMLFLRGSQWSDWANQALIAEQLRQNSTPDHLVTWNTRETSVRLVSAGEKTSVVWRSRWLGPQWVRRQLKNAGMDQLADQL